MIIQCEQCKTKFRLDDSRVTEAGVKVRCSKCKHTFIVRKEIAEEEPDFDKILSGFGSLPSEENGDGSMPGLVPSGAEKSVQGSEGFGIPEESGSEVMFSGGQSPEGSVLKGMEKVLASEEVESTPSMVDDTGFDDFTFTEEHSPVQSFTEDAAVRHQGNVTEGEDTEKMTEVQGDAEPPWASSLHVGDPQESAGDNDANSFLLGGVGSDSEVCAVSVESNAEPCLEIEDDKEPSGTGRIEAQVVAEDYVETASGDVPELDPWIISNNSFAGIKSPEVEGVPEIVGDSEGGENQTKEKELSPPLSEGDGHERKATLLSEFDAPVDDDLPPLSIASRRKGVSLFQKVFMALVIVFALAGTGYFIFCGSSEKLSLTGRGLTAGLFGQDVQGRSDFTIKNIEGTFLVNNEAGEIFVVRGEAFDNANNARSALRVKGVIYGAKGIVVAEQSVFCGKTLSNDQLMKFSMGEIDKILNVQTVGSQNNQVAPPGKGIPFTILFKNVPLGVGEFGVQMIVPTATAQ